MARGRSEITQAVRASRRWTAKEATEVLSAAHASGLSIGAFARLHGLVPQRLERWRRVLAAEASTDTTFVEVAREPIETAIAGARGFEVALRNGRVVRVGHGFDAEELGRLLAVVDKASC